MPKVFSVYRTKKKNSFKTISFVAKQIIHIGWQCHIVTLSYGADEINDEDDEDDEDDDNDDDDDDVKKIYYCEKHIFPTRIIQWRQ